MTRQEYYRTWRLSHKTELNAYARQYRKDNPRFKAQTKRHKATYKAKLGIKEKEQVYTVNYNRYPRTRYNYMKHDAKRRGINFDLPFDSYACLLQNPCHYCKGPLNRTSTGLDRMDNDKSIGYVIGNVLPCCNQCNRMRNNFLTVEEMKAVMTFLKSYRNEKRGY